MKFRLNTDNWPWPLQALVTILGTLAFAGVLFRNLLWEALKQLLPWFFIVAFATAAPPEIPGLKYKGLVAVKDVDSWMSDKKFGYSNCVIAVPKPGHLVVSSGAGRWFAEVTIPDVLDTESPVWVQVDAAGNGYYKVAVTTTRAGPWEQHYDPIIVDKSIPRERFDGRGLLYLAAGRPVESTHYYYNANISHVGAFFLDGTHRLADFNGQYVAGYLAHVPEPWKSRLGFEVYCGNVPLQQTNHAYLGPSVIALDFATNPVSCKQIVHPRTGHWTCLDTRTGATSRIYNDTLGTGQTLVANRIRYKIEYTTRATGSGIYGDNIWWSGVRGLEHGWYGDRKLTLTDPVEGTVDLYDEVDASKGYHNRTRETTVWTCKMADVLAAAKGEIEPWDVESRMTRHDFGKTLLGKDAKIPNWPVGFAVDHERRRVYIAILLRTTRGAEPTPTILVFEPEERVPVVTFQPSDTGVSVLVDGVSKPSPKLADWLNVNDEAKLIVTE